jgi:hypothetical protein
VTADPIGLATSAFELAPPAQVGGAGMLRILCGSIFARISTAAPSYTGKPMPFEPTTIAPS